MYRDRQIIIETFDFSQSDKLDWMGLESSCFVCHTKQIISRVVFAYAIEVNNRLTFKFIWLHVCGFSCGK